MEMPSFERRQECFKILNEFKESQAQVERDLMDKIEEGENAVKKSLTTGPLLNWIVAISMGIVIAFILFFSSCAYSEEVNMHKILMIESSGNPMAHRKVDNSRGLFQITPICLEEWNMFHPKNKYNEDDLWSPRINYRIAKWYMNKRIPQMIRHYRLDDTVDNRLIAYNAGISRLIDGIVPSTTKSYLNKYYRGVK